MSAALAASEAERLNYSRELAAYTLRQFSAARLSLDRHTGAAAAAKQKLPPAQTEKIDQLARSVRNRQAAVGFVRASRECGDAGEKVRPEWTRHAVTTR